MPVEPLAGFRRGSAARWKVAQVAKPCVEGVRSCNLAVWRADLLAVNGFDERFQGWGHEDADLVVRLFHRGCRRKEGHFAVPAVHLWHPENDRRREASNWARVQQVLSDREVVRAMPGLNQYLTPRGMRGSGSPVTCR